MSKRPESDRYLRIMQDAVFRILLILFLTAVARFDPAPGQDNWTHLGPFGGGVNVLIRDPFHSETFYVATSRGIFKSSDGGRIWRRLAPEINRGGESLAADPLQPGVVYAATIGSPTLIRSADAGQTWTPISAGLPLVFIRKVLVDGGNPQRVYVVGSSGIYYSEDQGSGWTRLDNTVGESSIGDLIIHSTDPDILIAEALSVQRRVFRSTDRGQSFTQVADESITGFVTSPAAPDRFYGLFSSTAPGSHTARIYRSQDHGASWQILFQLERDIEEPLSFSSLGLNPLTGNLYLLSTADGIWSSTNGGGSWVEVSTDPALRNATFLLPDGTDPARVTAGTRNRGVFQSLDSGMTWHEKSYGMQSLATSISVLDPALPSNIFVSMLWHGSPEIIATGDGGSTWTSLGGGFDPSVLAIDPLDSNRLYMIDQDESIEGSAAGPWVLRHSTDGGSTWTLSGVIVPLEHGFQVNWISRLVIDPTSPQTLFAAAFGTRGGGGIYRSFDRGSTWVRTLVSGDMDALAMDPDNPQILYAAAGNSLSELFGEIPPDGGVYKSSNGGDSWARMDTGLTHRNIRSLAIDPRDPRKAYASAWSDQTFESLDEGITWSLFQIDGQDVLDLAFHPEEAVSYAVLSNELLRRRGDGEWEPIGLPPGGAGSWGGSAAPFQFDRQDRDVLYARNTRGFFRFPGSQWLFGPGDPARSGMRFDGLAFSNLSPFQTRITLDPANPVSTAARLRESPPGGFSARDNSGVGPAGSTSELLLDAGRQVARLRSDLFSGDASDPAWFTARADGDVSTFFQYGASDLSLLDGGVAIESVARRLLFRLVYDGPDVYRGQAATTRLSLLNPSAVAVTATLVYTPQGEAGPASRSSVMLEIPAGEFVEGRASEFFGDNLAGGYVEVRTEEGPGLAGFLVIEFPEVGTVLGMNAETEFHHVQLSSAQFASVPGALFTDLTLINTDTNPRQILLAATREDGQPIGQPALLEFGPGESRTVDAGTLFPGAETLVGSLQVTVKCEGVAGGVVFGEPSGLEFAATLALQSRLFSESIFSQVASLPGSFFTGLAFFHPVPEGGAGEPSGTADAELEIEVFRADGSLAGVAARTLAPGQRLSELVDQLVPAATGQSGGYVRVRSTRPIVGQMLFASTQNGTIRLFSAVPPETLQ